MSRDIEIKALEINGIDEKKIKNSPMFPRVSYRM
jgi:hypothetical protein